MLVIVDSLKESTVTSPVMKPNGNVAQKDKSTIVETTAVTHGG